jgi:hypothetical protein
MYIISSLTSDASAADTINDTIITPKVPRGKRSDLTENDLEEFRLTFSELFHDEHF